MKTSRLFSLLDLFILEKPGIDNKDAIGIAL